MSNKVNEALFDLIQSMTKSEKRYFKLLSSRHSIGGENNYIKLFDAIEKQDEYDEEELFILFEGEALLNRFSITKKRLYDHILSALDAFHVSNSKEAQLYKMLHSIDLLYNKSLYDQSSRILRSAEKLAIKHEKLEILQILSQKKKRLIETKGYLQLTDECISEQYKKDDSNNSEVILNNELWSIKSRLFLKLSKKGISRTENDVEEYTMICKKVLDEELQPSNSIENNYLIYHIRGAYYYAIGQLENSLINLEENMKIFEKDQHNVIGVNREVSVFSNAIYICNRLGHHKKQVDFLSKMKDISKNSKENEDIEIKLFSSVSSIELNIYLEKGDFEKAHAVAQSIEGKLREFEGKITPIRKAFLSFKIAVVYLGKNDCNAALKWVNAILNDTSLDKTEDIVGYTQLLDLLIHIELKNDKLLPYSLKNTTRFFKSRNRLYGFETIFLQFINQLIKCDNHFDKELIWEKLNKQLDGISDNTFESVALDYFDFKSWAVAKLKNKAFNLVVREKYNASLRKAS